MKTEKQDRTIEDVMGIGFHMIELQRIEFVERSETEPKKNYSFSFLVAAAAAWILAILSSSAFIAAAFSRICEGPPII